MKTRPRRKSVVQSRPEQFLPGLQFKETISLRQDSKATCSSWVCPSHLVSAPSGSWSHKRLTDSEEDESQQVQSRYLQQSSRSDPDFNLLMFNLIHSLNNQLISIDYY